MNLAIRQRAVVDEHHRISIQVDELPAGKAVEIIVLSEPDPEIGAASFWAAVRQIQVNDLPEDYSTSYEDALYGPREPT